MRAAAVGLGLAFAGVARGADPALPEGVVAVDPSLQGLAWTVPAGALAAFRSGDLEGAERALRAVDPAGLAPMEAADRAFLAAWAAARGDRAEAAVDLLPALEGSSDAPDAWVALVRGQLRLAKGEPEAALAELAKVPRDTTIGVDAALAAHRALLGLGRDAEAWKELETLVARPDPAPGNAPALLLLAEHAGLESPAATPWLHRIRASYPGTPEDSAAGAALGASRPLDWRGRALRGEAWANQGRWTEALEATAGITDPEAAGDSLDACRLRYVRGRAFTKKNAMSDASQALAGVAKACANAGGDYGARGAYLLGSALLRRKLYAEAAAAFQELAATYPTHSTADDGLTKAGIALLEVGRAAEARRLWERALAEYPAGDTVPEALLRLAFARYREGDAADAIAIADRLGRLPIGGDALRVAGGRYWAARWRLYPDPADPNRAVADAAKRAEAVAGWKALCEEMPHSFYAVLAAARLYDVAPEVASALRRPPEHDRGESPVPWDVRLAVFRDDHVRAGLSLLRLGLAREGLAEIALADRPGEPDVTDWTADERAWITGLRIAAEDWLFAHDELRRWLMAHPLGTLGPHEARIARVAFPDRYWPEVRSSVEPKYRYEPRLFHALVREESNFNREIVSFAGAHGLSQLMPATAQQTAGWLGMKVTISDLDDPATNLKIGARYLDAMHAQLGGSPYLALAAYNGGAGNVNKWLAAQANPPTDEFVENIPFDETRGYVSRVMGTWQTYRYRFDDGAPFPDLSRFNRAAKPE